MWRKSLKSVLHKMGGRRQQQKKDWKMWNPFLINEKYGILQSSLFLIIVALFNFQIEKVEGNPGSLSIVLIFMVDFSNLLVMMMMMMMIGDIHIHPYFSGIKEKTEKLLEKTPTFDSRAGFPFCVRIRFSNNLHRFSLFMSFFPFSVSTNDCWCSRNDVIIYLFFPRLFPWHIENVVVLHMFKGSNLRFEYHSHAMPKICKRWLREKWLGETISLWTKRWSWRQTISCHWLLDAVAWALCHSAIDEENSH